MDKMLFTPGPLSTSKKVKEATLHDMGSRDFEFIGLVKDIREQLLKLAGVSIDSGFECIIIQGSGTYSIESVISSALSDTDHLLLLINGAYGERMRKIAGVYQIQTSVLNFPEDQIPSVERLRQTLEEDHSITHVAAVHCETTSGIYNPIAEIGAICESYKKTFIVDAMISFGAVPVNMSEMHIDFLISSSNKCIEGIPGFSFILCRREQLRKTRGRARTISLDMYSQWEGLQKNGQFRFTPPVHAILAFKQALTELAEERGVEARASRYLDYNHTLLQGMDKLGFIPYLKPENRGYIITSFYYPAHPLFDFERFYLLLNEKGFVIYPGKITRADCFRIGNIGHLSKASVTGLLCAIEEVLKEMNCFPL